MAGHISLRQPRPQLRFFQSRSFTATRRDYTQASKTSSPQVPLASQPESRHIDRTEVRSTADDVSRANLEKLFSTTRSACETTLSRDRVISEQEVLHVLGQCDSVAQLLVSDLPPTDLAARDGAASALLSLDGPPTKKTPSSNPLIAIQHKNWLDKLSTLTFSVVHHPTVFITPQILELYVKIQATLGRPESFPLLFYMYAHKPLPQDGSPVRYSKQNPNKISNAVPISAARRALQTAIDSRDLQVAMDIVETTCGTKAFRRSKFVRKGLLPATGAAAAPVAAYTVASQLAHLQTTMDPSLATSVAFAGIMAYAIFTGTIGVVAITTANDQMDRVTWAPGMPLRERWIREEERHAIDKIAGAWGFRESWRRGEEEGGDWDKLREWIGGKGMMLDRVELMDGME